MGKLSTSFIVPGPLTTFSHTKNILHILCNHLVSTENLSSERISICFSFIFDCGPACQLSGWGRILLFHLTWERPELDDSIWRRINWLQKSRFYWNWMATRNGNELNSNLSRFPSPFPTSFPVNWLRHARRFGRSPRGSNIRFPAISIFLFNNCSSFPFPSLSISSVASHAYSSQNENDKCDDYCD